MWPPSMTRFEPTRAMSVDSPSSGEMATTVASIAFSVLLISLSRASSFSTVC